MIFWMMPDSGIDTAVVMEGILKDFRKIYPEINLEIRVINRRALWAKIFTLKHDLGNVNCPDLIAFPHYWTEILATANLLEPLAKFDKDISINNVLDPLKPHCCLQDSAMIYSYPWCLDISALHYREDHLKAVCKNPDEMLSTWDGMLEVCARLKEHFSDVEDYYPMQNSDWRGSISHRGVLPCLWSLGADLFSDNMQVSGLKNPAFKKGMQAFIELALKRYMPILKERSSIGNISAGKSSMILSRRQSISMFEAQNVNFNARTLPVPRTGANYVNYLGCTNLGIVRNSKESEEAYTLLKWLTKPEKEILYASKMEIFPALEGAFESFLLASPQRVQNYTDIIATAKSLPNHIVSGAVMEIIANVMSAVASAILMNKYTTKLLDEELKKADNEIQEILQLYSE